MRSWPAPLDARATTPQITSAETASRSTLPNMCSHDTHERAFVSSQQLAEDDRLPRVAHPALPERHGQRAVDVGVADRDGRALRSSPLLGRLDEARRGGPGGG